MLARISRWTLPSLIIVAALGVYRLIMVSASSTVLASSTQVQVSQTVPWPVLPRYDVKQVATDAQLAAVMDRLQPAVADRITNNIVHALRLWGPAARFDAADNLSGAEMLDYLLDDAVFQQISSGSQPLFFLDENGSLQVRAWEHDYEHRISSSYHTNDILATFGESGVPLETEIITRQGASSVGDLLNSALLDFHISQFEYEWSAISYARYAYPLKKWRNKYGEVIRLNDLVNELIRHPLPNGPCNGLHRLEAMAVLYRIAEQSEESDALPVWTRRRMVHHMTQISGLLVQSQSSDGYWTRRWPEGAVADTDDLASLYDRVLVTGHHLEWLALAPQEAQPPRENVVRAAQWLIRVILEADEAELNKNYALLTHSARALCLWRSQDPYQAWRAGLDQPAMLDEAVRVNDQEVVDQVQDELEP